MWGEDTVVRKRKTARAYGVSQEREREKMPEQREVLGGESSRGGGLLVEERCHLFALLELSVNELLHSHKSKNLLTIEPVLWWLSTSLPLIK